MQRRNDVPLLPIYPRGEICIFAAVLFVACVISLVMAVVVNQLSRNSVADIAAQRNDRLKTFLLYLESLNQTISSAPTPNPLTTGTFIEQGSEIIIDRGPAPQYVPSTVDKFDAGNVNLTTTSFVTGNKGIFRISGDEVIDCCALAAGECSAVWQASEFTPDCCGNMVQMNATVGCGMNLSPEQVLRVSKLVPSAPSGVEGDTGGTGTLNVGHAATVASGRVSYDGGREIPITYAEYIIALNTSRKWTMAEVAPCGFPLQGTSKFNPCVYGGVLYPVDVISVYQGVSNNCQNPKISNTTMIKKPAMNLETNTDDSFTYDKPLTAISQSQYKQSQYTGSPQGWSNCQFGTSIFPNPWADATTCPVDANLKPQSGCGNSTLASTLTSCGSLRNEGNDNLQQSCFKIAPIQDTPSQDTAQYIFDPEFTYMTTPPFELVDDAVYEVRFGGTAMNFRPTTRRFKTTPQEADDGVCSTFNLYTITNDACGTQGCDFYFPPPSPVNCTPVNSSVTFACQNNTAFPFLRLSYSSAPMSFQLYPLCLAVPDPSVDENGNGIPGYNPAVFELIDSNLPFIYDYSLNPQTHQMDGVAYYHINLTKLETWQQAGATPSTVTKWKGQCGLFVAATPMMVTSSQQLNYHTMAIHNDPVYGPQAIDQCIYDSTITDQPVRNPYNAYDQVGDDEDTQTLNPCNPNRYHNGPYQNIAQCQSSTGDTCARNDAGQPMGYNHFCQTANFTMFNAYMEVITALPGLTESLEPTPRPSCTPTPAPAPPPGMKKKKRKTPLWGENEP